MDRSEFSAESPGRLVDIDVPAWAVGEAVGRVGGGDGRGEQRRAVAYIPAPLEEVFEGVMRSAQTLFFEVIEAERAVAELRGIGEDLPDARLLWVPLSKREAILSSRIENTIASARELAEAAGGREPEREEVREVLGYTKALEAGLESPLAFGVDLICELHAVMFARSAGARAGVIRRTQNFIGNDAAGFAGARFVPAPPGDGLAEGLADLERFGSRKFSPGAELIAIAMMHYQFEALHPFDDGNGRVGRLLIALLMCRMGLLSRPYLYLSGYFEPRRDVYSAQLMRVSTHGDWLGWLRFFLRGVTIEARDAAARIRSLRGLRAEYTRRLQDDDAPIDTLKVVDWLFTAQYVTAGDVESLTGRSNPTALKYLRHLEAVGALIEQPSVYRKSWIADRLLALIEAREASGGSGDEPER